MNINDLPEVKHLSDVVSRIDRNARMLEIQLKEIEASNKCTYQALGLTSGYATTLRLDRGPLDMDGCHIGHEMAQATLHLLVNKKQQLLARLVQLGVEFPASTKQPQINDL